MRLLGCLIRIISIASIARPQPLEGEGMGKTDELWHSKSNLYYIDFVTRKSSFTYSGSCNILARDVQHAIKRLRKRRCKNGEVLLVKDATLKATSVIR